MAQDKVHIPSGMGGLTRFDEGDQKSKLVFSPGAIIAGILTIIILIIALQIFLKF